MLPPPSDRHNGVTTPLRCTVCGTDQRGRSSVPVLAKRARYWLGETSNRATNVRHSIAETARAAGFGSTETLRRRFVAQFDVSPSQYRARFASTGTEDRPR